MDINTSLTTLIFALSAALCVGAILTYLIGTHRGPQRSFASQLQRLRSVPFLASLDQRQLTQIAKVVRELRVPANVYIIREQRQGEAMYIVMTGQLHILKRGTHDDTLVQTVGPGDVIGEMALLNDARRIASARTITPCVLLQIDRDDFFALLAEQQEIAAIVWDACEIHSIELAAADHARTRGMTLAERRRWIEARKSVDAAAGKVERPADGVCLAVITGAAMVDGKRYESPTLLRVLPAHEVRVDVKSRLCWLAESANRQ